MIQRYFSGAPWEETIGYARAVKTGDTIEVSGTTSVKEGVVHAPFDPFHQTVRIYEIINETLHHMDASLMDVTRIRIFVVDLPTNWQKVSEAHSAAIGNARPAMSMIGVSALINPELLVEIEVTAIISSTQ
jgi:enamine deaminase RidA (YjgF/YER057c/UK114 family)